MRQVKSLFLVLMMMILHHSFGDIDVIDGGGGGYGVVADGSDLYGGTFVVVGGSGGVAGI